MDWTKGIMTGLALVGALAAGVIGVLITMVVTVIILGIFDGEVVPNLNLDNEATANVTAVITEGYSFVSSLLTGLGIVGSLLVIAIVIGVFGTAGFLTYKFMKKKGGSGGNY